MPYVEPIQEDLERDRRYMIAQQLRGIAPQPTTKAQAIAQLLGNALAMGQEDKLAKEYGGREDAYRQALSGLLSGQGGMDNPDLQRQLAPLMLQRMFEKPDQLKASDLVQVDTPQGPQFVPASQAVGQKPYSEPKPKRIDTVPRGDVVDIYEDGVLVGSKPVAAKHDTVLRVDQSSINRREKDAKLPTTALKMQQEELDAISGASSINADLAQFSGQLEQGQLELGPLNNAISKARNWLGASTPESRNLASFQSTLERLRNESLRLNKGIQTEGDAQRAWNELINNINDDDVVKQRLAEIQKINERAVNIRKMNIDVLRQNFGVEPLDVGGFSSQPAAVGSTPGGFKVIRRKPGGQ